MVHGFRRGADRRGLLRRGMLPVLLGGHAGGGHDLLVLTDLDAEQLLGLGRLRATRSVIRPDLYGKHRS